MTFFADEYGNSRGRNSEKCGSEYGIAVLFAVFGSVIIRHFETTPDSLRMVSYQFVESSMSDTFVISHVPSVFS